MLDSGNKQKSFDDLYNDKNCKFRGYNCQIKQIYGLSFLVYTLVSSKERKITCNTADDSDKENVCSCKFECFMYISTI